jgi:hypothetical protein
VGDRKRIPIAKDRGLVERLKHDCEYEERSQRRTDVVVQVLEHPYDPKPGWSLWGPRRGLREARRYVPCGSASTQ